MEEPDWEMAARKAIRTPIETERLVIRPFEAADWPAVHAYTSDPTVMAYIPEGVMTAEQTQAFVTIHQGAEAMMWPVVLKEGGQLIGHMVFHPWFAPRTYEIGWVFHPAYHSQGYATEAAHSLLSYGFRDLGLHRIIATCQPENPASYRVMEKIGMRREGHFQKCIYRGGETWWDEYFYAILEEGWRR
jgi:ribosomal-protein-alanine N-acetyltransferase